MKDVGYEVGDFVYVPAWKKKVIVLGFEDNKLFDSVYCVKVMKIGASQPCYVLSDRVRVL
jgi:hypothetical protein